MGTKYAAGLPGPFAVISDGEGAKNQRKAAAATGGVVGEALGYLLIGGLYIVASPFFLVWAAFKVAKGRH
jgi:hypothetical protein